MTCDADFNQHHRHSYLRGRGLRFPKMYDDDILSDEQIGMVRRLAPALDTYPDGESRDWHTLLHIAHRCELSFSGHDSTMHGCGDWTYQKIVEAFTGYTIIADRARNRFGFDTFGGEKSVPATLSRAASLLGYGRYMCPLRPAFLSNYTQPLYYLRDVMKWAVATSAPRPVCAGCGVSSWGIVRPPRWDQTPITCETVGCELHKKYRERFSREESSLWAAHSKLAVCSSECHRRVDARFLSRALASEDMRLWATHGRAQLRSVKQAWKDRHGSPLRV